MGIFDFLKSKKEETSISTILPHQIYESGSLELKDVIAPSALKVTPKGVNLGEKVVRSFFVISYPRFLTDSWFAPIINLDKVFNVGIFIQPIETSQVLRTFQKKVAEVQSQINTREAKGLVRNPMLDTAYQDLENLRDQLQQAQERLFDVGLYLTIYADSENELDKVESEIKSILEAKLVYVKPALFQQEQGFKTTIPLGTDDLKVFSKLNSSPLSSLFPFISFDLTSDKGILYGINRQNSSLVLFDRFSLENYNSITFAKSGSGKSVRAHEPVLIRKNGEVKLVKIGGLVEKTIRKFGATPIDHEMEGTIDPGFEVWSFDKELKGSWSKVSLAARKSAPKNYFRFETKSGRKIDTTGDHNMLVIRDGRVEVIKSTEVDKNDYVPLPRKVDLSRENSFKLNLLDLLSRERGLYVIGAEKIVSEAITQFPESVLDNKYDRYLYKYKSGRRISLKYFNKIVKKTGLNIEGKIQSLCISSGSGKGKLPAILEMGKDLAKILGYINSEGTINTEAIQISNLDENVREDIKNAYKNVGVLHYSSPTNIITADRAFISLIYALKAGGRFGKKKVPEIIFQSGEECIREYLSSYFEGDGGVSGVEVSATSKSKELLSGMAYLLYGFGIIARLHKKRVLYKKTNKHRVFWTLTVSGQKNLRDFKDKVGFVTETKQKKLDLICNEKENTNVDIIPNISVLVNELILHFGTQLHGISNLSPISRGIYNPSREDLNMLIKEIEKRVLSFREMKGVMNTLSDLPTLESLIRLGEKNKELNSRLWKELGSSWAWMKKRGGEVGIENTLTLAKIVLGNEKTEEIEVSVDKIHSGFLKLDASIKDFDHSFGVAMRKNLPDRTSYSTITSGANFISQTYKAMEEKLPHIEGILDMLKRLGRSDLMWDRVISIEKYTNKNEKYVYDLTVDNEVFLAGEAGMFVHNSYGTKLEILRTLMFDVDCIVIDPEREYEYLAEAVGGRYFNISLNSEHHINPFELPAPGEGESFANVLRSNIINLVGLFRIMMGGLTPEEDAIIDRAITETYALKDITADSNFENIEPPLMSDFELVLSGMEGGDSLAQRLTKYTRGTWAGFINKPSNIDINKKFIVFSVRDMEDELKPIAMYIVMHYIWNMIRKKLKKRLLVIDEAWWMMKSEDTASFLLSLAKRGRKYYLGLATITQDVDDFMKSPYGIPIITNSSIQILLKQSPTSIDKLQQTFNLTDEEKYLLLESDVGEGIFFAGLKHVAIKIIASYTEDQIITSDPSQILAIKNKKEELERSM